MGAHDNTAEPLRNTHSGERDERSSAASGTTQYSGGSEPRDPGAKSPVAPSNSNLGGAALSEQDGVLFYDGDCGLCHASVKFALARDPEANFRFAPLFGDTYEQLRALNPSTSIDFDSPPDTLLLVHKGNVLIRSKAVAQLLSGLESPWPTVGKALGLVPRLVADLGYRLVAGTRKLLFRTPDAVCPLVPPEQRARFLP